MHDYTRKYAPHDSSHFQLISTLAQLMQAKAQTGWARSRSLYNRLIVVTVSTGLATAVVAGVSLALVAHNPNNSDFETP